MKRQDFIELRDFVAKQMLDLRHFHGATLPDMTDLASSTSILENAHAVACRQIDAMAIPAPTHPQMQCLVKLAASLKRIGYDFPEADDRIQVVANALLEIAREGGGA